MSQEYKPLSQDLLILSVISISAFVEELLFLNAIASVKIRLD